jgi:hypothetical protein
VKVFGGALETVGDLYMKEQIPDNEERQLFAANVRADIENLNHQLYTISYILLKIVLI